MNYNKLPADPIALILGIVSLVVGFAGCCCCYGIFAFVPILLSIVGLIMANKSLKEFDQNQQVFSPQSRNNVVIAKTLNIVSIVINSIIFISVIIVFIFYGTLLSQDVFKNYKKEYQIEDQYEMEEDSTYNDFELLEEIDSNEIETTRIKLNN
ncbi:CCC motif membrane protein [Flavobacterium sp. HNIBRBA15423]|uniref:CCC motif membrane protein n=1 Tax=Flavobacterium sp. HNIBRBA15423 TaxID=3458683 RepID=UPI004043D8F0